MAKLKVYSVYDAKVNAFARPFFMRTRGEALRGWQDVVNDTTTDICKYPNDFSLMELADFDEESGTFHNLVTPLNLGLASQFKNTDSQPQLKTVLNTQPAQINEAI